MEAVQNIEGVCLPVLTPNIKVNYVHLDGLCYYILHVFASFSILLFALVVTRHSSGI